MNFLKLTIIAATASVLHLGPAVAADKDLSCHLSFTTNEWSILYASASGTGTVTCKNGDSMHVAISAKGVGITAGKWQIQHGKGQFTDVTAIDEVLGSYFGVSTNIGLAKAGTAQALTKGRVSLTLTGKGQGFDVGISISSFTISRLEEKNKKEEIK